jgi:hypothetical protein
VGIAKENKMIENNEDKDVLVYAGRYEEVFRKKNGERYTVKIDDRRKTNRKPQEESFDPDRDELIFWGLD